MKMRRGQVALYLVLVLVAITVLVLMNVNVFLAVRAKNHATAAGDAAALAAAKVQADLLCQIGLENKRRLEAAVFNRLPDYDYEGRRDCDDSIRRACFLAPLKAISEACRAAELAVAGLDNGGMESFEVSTMADILRQHVFDIRSGFVQDTQLYPEPWEGAWETYAQELEANLSGGIVAGPENCEFADAYEEFPLLSQAFYRAIAGRQWCWFKFNGEWIFQCDSRSMPRPTRARGNGRSNSEVYSLHLSVRPLPEHLDEEWTNVILRITGCTLSDIENSWVLTNGMHRFAFYDNRWNKWSTYPGILFSPDQFPIRGPVKAKYDVLGCAAVCRVRRQVPEILSESDDGDPYEWTAAAKPFGNEINLDGDEDVVTCLKRLVTSEPWEDVNVRLVPVDSVGGRDLHTADAEWMEHVRNHIPDYLDRGVSALGGCWYCQQLVKWEDPGFRREGEQWLRVNAGNCQRSTGPGDLFGGTMHAH